MKNKNLAFTDTETTGLDYLKHEIISLGLILRDPQNNILVKKAWYMHPTDPESVDPKAISLNGYTREKWDELGVVTHEQAFTEYFSLVKDAIFVAHNTFFDKIMLMEAVDRYDLKWSMDYHSIDTSTMAWALVVRGLIEKVSLRNVCDYFNISNEGEHNVMVDVERMVKVYDAMVKMLSI